MVIDMLNADDMRVHFTNNNRRRDLRRMPPGAIHKKFVVKEMSDRHHKVAQLAALGLKNKDIAEKTGFAFKYIQQITNSPVVRNTINMLKGADDKKVVNVTKRIAELCDKSADIFEAILNEGELATDMEAKRLQLKAAEGIWDRGGHGKQTKVNVAQTNLHVTPEQLLELKTRAIAAGAVIEDNINEAEIVEET